MKHGTWTGYNAGCREECCRTAARNYQKRRMYDVSRGVSRKVSSLGLRRRIEALACLGWDMYAIARHVQTGRETVRQWTLHETVYRSSHERMARVYDDLSMRLPPERNKHERANAAKTRNRAKRMGWLPPLAWDDIDDETEQPTRGSNQRHNNDVDEAVVLRVLAGENLPTTRAEKDEITRRWVARGGSRRELAARFGWKDDRYGKGDAA